MYVAVRAQTAQASGEIIHEMKPTSVDGCSYGFDAMNSSFSATTPTPTFNTNNSFQLHHISYFYFAILASSTTIIAAYVATLITRDSDPSSVQLKLLAPFIRKYFRKNSSVVDEVQMEEIKHVFDVKDN